MLWSAAICAASVLIGIYALFANRDSGTMQVVFGGWCLVPVTVPPFLAMVTAQIAQRKLIASDFELVYVTPLSNRQLVQWLVVLGLQHTRNWIRVVMGITAVLVVIGTYLATYDNLISCLVVARGGWAECQIIQPLGWMVFGTLIHHVMLFVNLWIAMLSAATLGLMLSVWSRGSYIAHYFAAFATAICIGIGMVSVVNRPLQEAFRNNIQIMLWQLVLIGVCYVVASVGIRRLR